MTEADATNGRFNGDLCQEVQVKSPRASVRLEKPCGPPDGIPDPSYQIVYDFTDTLFREYYHASSVSDILCPIGVNLELITTKRSTLSAVGTSIMNAIKDH